MEHFASDPVDRSRCRPVVQSHDAVLVLASDFAGSQMFALGKSLAYDDGIVRRVASSGACACAGRNVILHTVSWNAFVHNHEHSCGYMPSTDKKERRAPTPRAIVHRRNSHC